MTPSTPPQDQSDSVARCPCCGSVNIQPHAPPPAVGPARYAFALLVLLGVLVIALGTPLRRDVFVAALIVATIPCYLIGGWLAERRNRRVAQGSPERWRCINCDLEGNLSHFRPSAGAGGAKGRAV